MNILSVLSYAMETAYGVTKTMDKAVDLVVSAYRDADRDILEAMWLAIDAYIDINCK